MEAVDYYPFGLRMPGRSRVSGVPKVKEGFTGKEYDAESGFMYFGARLLDPAAGSWLSVDPLAEKYYSWSPYNYVVDNPVNNFDPDGMDIKITQKAKENSDFQESLSLMLKTNLGKNIYKTLDKNRTILVIITINEEMIGLNGATQYISSKNGNYKIDGESFLNKDNKKVVIVTVNPSELKDSGVVEASETIYHELEAHVKDFAQDPVVLDSDEEDHEEYGRTYSGEDPQKGSKAEKYIVEAEKAKEDEENK